MDLGIEPIYDGSFGQEFCPKDTPPAKHQPRLAPWSMPAVAVLCLPNVIVILSYKFSEKENQEYYMRRNPVKHFLEKRLKSAAATSKFQTDAATKPTPTPSSLIALSDTRPHCYSPEPGLFPAKSC